MTGTQQSGSGGNPEFDTPQDRKSAGGVEKATGPATANPGREYGESTRERPSQPAETRQRREGDGTNRQQEGGQQQSASPQESGGRHEAGGQRRESTRDPAGLQEDDDESTDIEERAAADTDRTGAQQRRDTGTPGSSDQAEPDEEGVMYDENKSAK
jgi:hypothetical protein